MTGAVRFFQNRALFPGKSPGDTYQGTFSVDPAATVTQSFPDAADYDGSFFDLSIDGVSYNVRNFRVWSSSVPGVQISFDTVVGSAILALRSSDSLYVDPGVPTSFDVSDFDKQARTSLFINCDFSHRDMGTIIAISPVPEPTTMVLAGLGFLSYSLACGSDRRRNRKRRFLFATGLDRFLQS